MRLPCLAVPLLLAVIACGDDVGPTPPPPGGTLISIEDGTWYLQTADGETLPTKISERFIGVTLEEVFLDSAQLTVDSFDGRYAERYWLRVNHTAVEDRREFVYDEGSYAEGSGAFVFNSTVRARTFTITTPSATELLVVEPMLFYPGATSIEGVYRRTRP